MPYFTDERLATAWSMLWWIIPLAWVLIVASMVYEVRNNPMFQRASPYMNAMDAWEVAYYTHLNEQNGLYSNDASTPPQGSSLPAGAWWKILILIGASALFVGKGIRGKWKKMQEEAAQGKSTAAKAADANKTATDMERVKKQKNNDPTTDLTEVEKDTLFNESAKLAAVADSETSMSIRAQRYISESKRLQQAFAEAEASGDTAAADAAYTEYMEHAKTMEAQSAEFDAAFREHFEE